MRTKPTLMNHELIGQIIAKEPKKVYDKKSPFYGQAYFKLKVLTEDKEKATFFVYPNLVSSELFQTIAHSQYVDKRYLLCAEKKKKGFLLHSWKELKEVEDA